MRVLKIINGTIVDGEGLRTSIYFAGCKHKCKGCHNPQSWDFNSGKIMTIDEILKNIKENDLNVTFSGGDPLYQNLEELVDLSKKIHELKYNIWLYTGFTIEELKSDSKYHEILKNVDFIVDGPFIEEQRDITLAFRGSKNQRILKRINNDFIDVTADFT